MEFSDIITCMFVNLCHKEFVDGNKKGKPLVILHGFLGSSSNWISTGKELSINFDVYALDLRNHGRSPHAEPMTYETMEEDILHWLRIQQLREVILLGHSMGGKLAMRIACRHSDLVKGLIVEDIAPRDYVPAFDAAIGALLELDLKIIKSRKEAEHFLRNKNLDEPLIQFLLMNLARRDNSEFYWQANFPTLRKSQQDLVKNSLAGDDSYNGPCLVLKGESSHFLKNEDLDLFGKFFKNLQIHIVENAGHNIHTEKKDSFVDAVRGFKVE